MSDIFATDTVLYNGSEAIRSTPATNYYPTPNVVGGLDAGFPASTVAPSATQSKFGGNSMRFAGGADDYVCMKLAVAFDWALESAFYGTTLEAWIRPDSVSGTFAIFSLANYIPAIGGTPTTSAALVQTGAQLALYVNAATPIPGGGAATFPAGTLVAGAWHHVAWVLRGDGRHAVFLNGTEIITYVGPCVSSLGVARYYAGGAPPCGTTYPAPANFAGYMDDVRYSPVTRYTTSFTAPAAAFDTVPAASTQGSGTAASSSTASAAGDFAYRGTAAGTGAASAKLGALFLGSPVRTLDPIASSVVTLFERDEEDLTFTTVVASTVQTKNGPNSFRFPGDSLGVLRGENKGTVAPSNMGGRTVEAWIRPDNSTAAQVIASRSSNVTDFGNPFWSLLVVGGAFVLCTNDPSGSFASLPVGSAPSAAWTHFRWTASPGAAPTHTLHVNGTKVLELVLPGATSGTACATATRFGAEVSTWINPTYPSVARFTGFMDSIRETAQSRSTQDFVPNFFELTVDSAPTAQGDGTATSTSTVGAFSNVTRFSTASTAGTSTAAATGSRVRGGTGSATGLAGVAGESDNDVSPPTTAVAVSFVVTIEADTITIESIVGTWSAATTQAGSIVLDGALNAAPAFAATWATQQELSAELFALVRMLGTLPQQNDRGLAWVVNTLTGGSSLYEGFDFNSFGRVDTTYIGCKSDGIYVLDGDDDNGTPIQASVSFGKTDLGSEHIQRMIKAYVDLASTAPMTLKITANGEEFLYPARDFDEVLTTQRFDVGRGLEARYFTFEIFNTDGCDFTMSNAEFLTNDVMHRRI